MSLEENKAIIHAFWEEVWNKGNLAAADELVATDFALYLPASPVPFQGPEGLKQWATTIHTAFPSMHFSIEDEIAEGDKVVTRWTGRGTHKGEMMGIPPTGKQVTITGISFFRIAGGKIVEDRAEESSLGLLQQLGALPPLGQAGK